MRNRFDELAKQLGEAGLGPCGDALPADAYVRSVAEPVLLQFHHILQNAQDLGPDEQEFIMVMHKSWSETRAEGRAEGRVETLRKQLAIKFGEISHEVDAQISGASPEHLYRYLERILFADSVDAVFA
jgi:hypothetical protein